MSVRILVGDCREMLKTLPDESVHCVVTSPPYWGLRDYGTAKWEGGDAGCDHKAPPNGGTVKGSTLVGTGNRDGFSVDGQFKDACRKCGAKRIDSQLGLEQTPDEYVTGMVAVFREVRRVLRKDGTLWLNLGDSYANTGNKGQTDFSASKVGYGGAGRGVVGGQPSKTIPHGLKQKDLCGIPWRVAFALQADGWWLRQDIIWAKPNPMPESVRDRCTKAHEYLFLLSKSATYYYDAEAIAEPVSENQPWADSSNAGAKDSTNHQRGATSSLGMPARKRSGNKERKPATERDCPRDGVAGSVPWEGVTRNKRSVWTVTTVPFSEAHFATFPPALIEPCVLAGCPVDGTILDPFGGAGTTGLVADRKQRNAILIELNPEYAAMAERRIHNDAPLFAQVTA